MTAAIFIDVLKNKPITGSKKSSLIAQWLGKSIPQSLSIRIGNYLETYFNTLIGENNLLHTLDTYRGNKGVWVDNEFHQVDIFACIDGQLIARELKTNLDLDRGKKRDVLKREEAVKRGLSERYNEPVDTRIFSPFIETSEVNGLGIVEGLAEFIDNFNLDITVDEFTLIGKNHQVHQLLNI